MNNTVKESNSDSEVRARNLYLTESMEETFKKYFPKSHCYIKVVNIIGEFIQVNLYLGSGEEDWSGGYEQNDCLNCKFIIHDIDKEENYYELEKCASSFHVEPWEHESYLAYSTVKVPYRKLKGNADKIIKGFDKYCKKLKDSLVMQLGNFKGNHEDVARKNLVL